MINEKGFHGTSEISAKSIMNTNFEPSIGNSEWLGDGVYFFVDGLSKKPIDKSREWAIVQSWDNELKRNTYDKYSIIESDISFDDKYLLDLTTSDGIEVFEYMKDKFRAVVNKSSKSFVYLDGLVINLAIKKSIFRIDLVKGNFYIKTTDIDRKKQVYFRTPNCTICSVVNLGVIKKSNIIETEKI